MPSNKVFSKIFILFSLFLFFAAALTVAYHSDNYSYQLSGCSLCNIKDSISLSLQKFKNDPLPAFTASRPRQEEVFLETSEILLNEGPLFYTPSLLSRVFVNKAPPFIS
jgi:hypothetical protein